MSWGPMLGSYLTAIEPRISLNIFYAGGLQVFGRPEANLAHFIPRITIPTLMINGRYDPTFRVDYYVTWLQKKTWCARHSPGWTNISAKYFTLGIFENCDNSMYRYQHSSLPEPAESCRPLMRLFSG